MASTRNNNTKGNYDIYKRMISHNHGHIMNPQQGESNNTAFPNAGIHVGRTPRQMLSNNPIDIESALFGINSTNLEKPQKPVKPELKTLPNVTFFERSNIVMPQPFVHHKNQRPMYLS